MRILESLGLCRPEPLRPLPGHPARRRPRRARGVADRAARPGLHRRAPRRAAGAAASTAAPTASRAASSAGCTEDEGTWLGHVLEHVAIELQNVAGEQVTFGKTRGAGTPGRYHVVYEYEQEDGRPRGGPAWRCACSTRCCPRRSRPQRRGARTTSTSPRSATSFIRFAQRRALGPSTASLVRAAEERDIPWLRLNDQSLVQFGHGKYQQRIQATVTSRTSHIAVEIASDKEETNKILGDLGLPVPQQRLVQREDDAVARPRAHRLSGRGQAVQRATTAAASRSTSRDEEQVVAGLPRWRGEHAAASSSRPSSRAHDHRMLVVNGELVAVSKRVPGPRRRRRRAHDRASWSRCEPRPAPRHRPREGAHPARVRRPGRAPAGQEHGYTKRHGAGRRARSSTCARPATSRPAAPRSTSPTSSTPTTARWRCARSRRSGSTSAASTS